MKGRGVKASGQTRQ